MPLGINLDGFDQRRDSPSGGPFAVGYLARIAPEKGLSGLCDAYVRFRQMPGVENARLEVAGYLAPDQQKYLKDAERRLTSAGFGGEFHYRGALDRAQKIEFLRGLDVFSVPTVYVEPKGSVSARGDGVRRAGRAAAARRLPGDAGEDIRRDARRARRYAEPRGRVCTNCGRIPALRVELGQNGFDGVREHYSIGRSADRMLEVYTRAKPRAARGD